ncbi:hemolytic enterotoxin [Aphanothece sacrum]|uniref:Uncharacterized protein n=1 Tax=Aphanothece sacrum FPU1 TaxID=1920663 RepID=A0A401IN23_APHSA|nr:hemolytic enterotoxin [Aphanothece sacrum]GBF82636.1 hypothetical protein AsFPU1_4066 [Aphanothece sacrum FPU1]GBF86183.1 hypothetical protein AsFPU3_3254 [Aphanothece sacrum FPU3]
MSVTIESDLKEILNKFDQKLDKLDSKIDKLSENVDRKIDQLSQDVDQKFNKLSEDVNSVKVSVVRLEEKVEGLSKRAESQEFVSRGVLIGLIVAILGGAAKLLGFVGNP